MPVFSEGKCPRCEKNSILSDDSTGEKFCSKCGYVVSEKSELVPLSVPDNPSEASSTMSNIGSSTIINPQNKDAFGKPISQSMKDPINRLREQDVKTKTYSSEDKNLKKAESEIGKLKDKLVLSDSVIEKTKSIYKKTVERKLTKGYTVKGMVGACLYASCKDLEIPRTLKDISDSIGIKKNDVSRCYKLIFRELEMKIIILDPKIHVPRIGSVVGASEKSKRRAISILEQAKKEGINIGKDPMGMIAGALYLACIRTNEGKTQKEIANASKVTEKIIRTRCKELSKIA